MIPPPQSVTVPASPARALSDEDCARWRARLDAPIGDALNVVRDGDSLRRCLDVLDDCARDAAALPDGGDTCAVRQRITAARLVAASALERPQSVGCHVRSDTQPEPEVYALNVQKGHPIAREIFPKGV